MAITEERKQELLRMIAEHNVSKSTGISPERKAQLDAILANHKVEKVTTPAPSLTESLSSTIQESGQSFVAKEAQRLETLGTAAKGVLTGQIPVTQAGNIFAGQIAGVVNDLAGEFITGVGSTWYKQQPKETQEKIDNAVQGVLGTTIPGTDQTIQDSVAKLVETYQAWRERNPEEAVQAESVANLLSVVPLAGVEEAASAAARRAASEVILSTGGQVKRIGPRLGERIVEGAVARTGKGVVGETLASAKRTFEAVPGRIEANRAAMEAERLMLEPLPQVQRDAITNGILPRDVQVIRELSVPEKTIAKTMVEHADQFGINRAAQDPAEFVGKEVTTRIQDINSLASQKGAELGDLVASLPDKTLTQPLAPAIIARLNEVPGLRGLVLTPEGELDFSRTVLAGRLSKDEQRTVASAFSDALNMDAEQAHLYRQQLFDVLDGKGKAGLVLNGVEPKALNAVRQGIADVLEETIPGYKVLNQQNAELLGLLSRYKKFYKGLNNAPGDIMDARGASLARRLTSNAQSGQDISLLFTDTEDILRKYGILYDVNIKNLQDLLNAIERYFDVTKDTGFAGQIRVGVGDIKSSILGTIAGKATEFGGKTDAVRRDAFRKLLSEETKLPGNAVPDANAKGNNPENTVPNDTNAD